MQRTLPQFEQVVRDGEVVMTYTCELCEREADTEAKSDLRKAIATGEAKEDTFFEFFCYCCGARFTEEERAEIKAEAMS